MPSLSFFASLKSPKSARTALPLDAHFKEKKSAPTSAKQNIPSAPLRVLKSLSNGLSSVLSRRQPSPPQSAAPTPRVLSPEPRPAPESSFSGSRHATPPHVPPKPGPVSTPSRPPPSKIPRRPVPRVPVPPVPPNLAVHPRDKVAGQTSRNEAPTPPLAPPVPIPSTAKTGPAIDARPPARSRTAVSSPPPVPPKDAVPKSISRKRHRALSPSQLASVSHQLVQAPSDEGIGQTVAANPPVSLQAKSADALVHVSQVATWSRSHRDSNASDLPSRRPLVAASLISDPKPSRAASKPQPTPAKSTAPSAWSAAPACSRSHNASFKSHAATPPPTRWPSKLEPHLLMTLNALEHTDETVDYFADSISFVDYRSFVDYYT